MKLVEMCNLTFNLFYHNSLNVRIVFLVRDPRGTMQSRKHKKWCQEHTDCENPENLCRDLVGDHETAVKLAKEYPSTFK